MSKLQIISDKNKKSSSIKNLLLNKIKSNHFKRQSHNCYWWQWFMLQTLKRIKILTNIFMGLTLEIMVFSWINFHQKTLKNLSKANLVTISPLEMIVKNKNNQTKRSIAINEVSVLDKVGRQPHYLLNGFKQIIKKLVSDGVLVSTLPVVLLIIFLCMALS